MKHKQLDT